MTLASVSRRSRDPPTPSRARIPSIFILVTLLTIDFLIRLRLRLIPIKLHLLDRLGHHGRLPHLALPLAAPATNSTHLAPRIPLPGIHAIKRIERLLADQHALLAALFDLRQFLAQPVLLGKLLAVVEEQFFADVDVSKSDEFDPMLAVDEHDLGFAVQPVFLVVGVVDEAGFVAVACGVDDPVAIEVEEEGEKFAVVDDAAALCFRGGDDLWTLAPYSTLLRLRG